MPYDTLEVTESRDMLPVESASADAETGEVFAPDRGPILVAVDFSTDSAAALNWALDHADIMGAPVHVVHIVHDPADAPGTYKPPKHDLLRPMADVAGEMMEGFIARIEAERPRSMALELMEKTLLSGLPAPAILNMAKRLPARMAVLGTRGRKGLQRLILGSIAARVVENSPVPVTVVKAGTP